MRPVKRALKMLESPEENMSEKDQVVHTRQVSIHFAAQFLYFLESFTTMYLWQILATVTVTFWDLKGLSRSIKSVRKSYLVYLFIWFSQNLTTQLLCSTLSLSIS